MVQTQLSRQEIYHVLQEVVFDQGPALTLREFVEQTGIAESQIRKHFGSWMALRREHGWTGEERDQKQHTDDDLWEAYHALVEKFSRFPTMREIDRHTRFASRTYYTRFGAQPLLKREYRRWLTDREPLLPASGGRQSPDSGGSPVAVPTPLGSPTRDGGPEWVRRDQLEESGDLRPPLAEGASDVPWLRERWEQLRVAFVLRSSEFRERAAHHWDLLVVLEHDWPACPVKVLRLSDLLPETVADSPGSTPLLGNVTTRGDTTRSELYGRMPWE